VTIKLTKRQQQIFDLIKEGRSNKDIAKWLKVSESSVKLHVGGILKKYGARNRRQLMLSGLKGIAPENIPEPMLPEDVQPCGWIHMHGGKVVGIMFTKKRPKSGWQPLYTKKEETEE
jgi:DNA-binding CsgD family transcriptional regulator